MSTPCRYKEALRKLVLQIEASFPHTDWKRHTLTLEANALLASDGPCNPPDPFEVWWSTPPKLNEVHPNEICDSREGALVKRIAKAAWDAATKKQMYD